MNTQHISGDWQAGDTITWLPSRTYYCTGSKPYTRKDGAASEILTWQGRCCNCGKTYTFLAGRFSFCPVANCEQCRATYTPTELARRGRKRVGAVAL